MRCVRNRGEPHPFDRLTIPMEIAAMSTRLLAPAALKLSLALGQAALADEKLPPDQQAKVEEKLKSEGFTKWEEIELEDGMIEVDDAIDANGKKTDLKLDPKTLEIVKRKAE